MAADPNTLRTTRELDLPGIYFCLARIPETERLIVGGADGNLHEIDLAAEKPQSVVFGETSHQGYVTGVALAGQTLVSGAYDQKLVWWDLESRSVVRAEEAHQRWIRDVIASPDGRWVVSIGDDMVAKIWDAETGELRDTLADHQRQTPNHYPSMLYACAFSPDGRRLATGDKVGHIALWDVESGRKIGELESPGMYTWDPRQRRHSIGGIRSLAFTPDGARLAAGGIGEIGNIDHLGGPARIELFELDSGKSLSVMEDENFKGLVEEILFAADGSWFISVGGDHAGFVTIYDAGSGKIVKQERGQQHIHAAALDESRTRLYTAHHGRVMQWSLEATPEAS